MNEKKIRNRVTAVDRATDIIEFVVSCGEKIRLSHILTNLDIPRQYLIRTLNTFKLSTLNKAPFILLEQSPGSEDFHTINSSKD